MIIISVPPCSRCDRCGSMIHRQNPHVTLFRFKSYSLKIRRNLLVNLRDVKQGREPGYSVWWVYHYRGSPDSA